MLEKIAKAKPSERNAIFLEAASIKNISAAMIEKDFWVCWVLKRIFSDTELSKLLCFKGGTSLSKAFNLIERFSEDIDLILNWDVVLKGRKIIQPSNTKQDLMNKEINADAEIYISTTLKQNIEDKIQDVCTIQSDINDKNILQIEYPKAINDKYLLPFIKLEIGPLAAWSPNKISEIKPYIEVIKGIQVDNIDVPTIIAERTFWEKITILHKEHYRDEKRKFPERYSRHYYDVYKMGNSYLLNSALEQINLLKNVVDFKKRFYPCGWARYDLAVPETIQLMPSEYNREFLRNDYKKMESMIFGDYPTWDEILEYLQILENKIHSLL